MIKQTIETFDFDGPLPPPHILEWYEKISPGFAERIMTMAESEMIHRHEIEKKELDADILSNNKIIDDYASEIRLGQVFAFIITLFLASIGTFVIVSGNPVSGSILSSTGICGIVTTFILGRTRGKNVK